MGVFFSTIGTIIAHALFIMTSAVLLAFAVVKHGRTRKVLSILFVLVIGAYIVWFITKNNWKNEMAEKYIDTYKLNNYKDHTDCQIEIKSDNTYRVYTDTKTYETGEWEYYDDGDMSFIRFRNGGRFGYEGYEIKE